MIFFQNAIQNISYKQSRVKNYTQKKWTVRVTKGTNQYYNDIVQLA